VLFRSKFNIKLAFHTLIITYFSKFSYVLFVNLLTIGLKIKEVVNY